MRLNSSTFLFLSIIVLAFSCEIAEIEQEDPTEIENEHVPLDTIEISINGNPVNVSRFNAIKNAETVPHWYSLFICEGEDLERIEFYTGSFTPDPFVSFKFKFSNYIDENGILFTNGSPVRFSHGTHDQELEPQRFNASFKGGLFNDNGDSIIIDMMKINVPYIPAPKVSHMAYILQNDTLETGNYSWIMIDNDLLKFSGSYYSNGEVKLYVDFEFPRNISVGTYAFEDLGISRFSYKIANEDRTIQPNGILTISKLDYFNREVEGRFETTVLVDGNEEDFIYIFNYYDF